MRTKEFYEMIGQDYESVLERMMGSEELIAGLLDDFLRDDTFERLKAAVQQGDAGDVFCQAHTLKGLALNLGLKPLACASELLVEMTRNQRGPIKDEARTAFHGIETAYTRLTELLQNAAKTESVSDET